jgi:hypothetical protein
MLLDSTVWGPNQGRKRIRYVVGLPNYYKRLCVWKDIMSRVFLTETLRNIDFYIYDRPVQVIKV